MADTITPGSPVRLIASLLTMFAHTTEDGQGEVSETSRPLRDGEIAEWVLLDGVGLAAT